MRFALATAVVLSLASGPVRAADDIVVGVIYPMTGPQAPLGVEARGAYETAAEIVNGSHPVLPLEIGQGGGFAGLGGAKLKLVFADSKGDPATAAAEAEKLIGQGAVALIGSYSSATSNSIGDVAERLQRPYIDADATALDLTRHGRKWFFRTSPDDTMFTAAMFQFFQEQGRKSGHPVGTVALFYEDSVFGRGSADSQRKLAAENHIEVVADIKYAPGTTTFEGAAKQLKAANADVFMPSAYAVEAVAILKAMDAAGYKPRAIMAQAAGAHEEAYIKGAGPLAEGTLSRASFVFDAGDARPAITAVNAMYKSRTQQDLNDNTAREITALLALASAIDTAGSTKPEALRRALVETDISGRETIMPWEGIKFDATGQNIMALPVIEQLSKGSYHTVWPFLIATKPVVWGLGK